MFHDYSSLCAGLGAADYVPKNQEDLLAIQNSFQDFSGVCNNKFWVPVRRKNGRYVFVYVKSFICKLLV